MPHVPRELLPKIGIIKEDCGAVWIYHDNSVGVCFMMWMTTNPEHPGSIFEAIRTIGELTEAAQEVAAANDYHYMFTTCHHKDLTKLHIKNGFVEAADNVVILGRGIDNGP